MPPEAAARNAATEFDVVVVGAGGAGLAAAITAAEAGRSVVLLEKNAKAGGSTALSIGSITATGTPHQLRKGIEDRPEDHWADMALFAPEIAHRDNDALRWVLCEDIPGTFQWLLAVGIRFFGPIPEPPHRQPRMHNVLPNSGSFIYHLLRAARKSGVEIRTGIRAEGLVTQDRRIVAVDARDASGSARRFTGRGGIVLATGDFTASPELKARYMGEREARVEAVNPTATGDGQSMAVACGAQILNGDLALGPELRFVPPAGRKLVQRLPPWPSLANAMAWSLDHMPDSLLRPFVMSFVTTALAPSPALFEAGAVLVNSAGERFTEERDAPAIALAEQAGKIGYIVVDDRVARLFIGWPHFVSTAPGIAYAYLPDYRRNRPDIYRSAPTLVGLAGKLGMAGERLAAAVAAHNDSARDRPSFGPGPFVALGPVRPVFVHAEGGLAVDAHHRVLGADGAPIPGLYAAGSTGQGGLLLKGHGHHLAWAFVSGRRAGRFAADGA